jgi:hypothetical protein
MTYVPINKVLMMVPVKNVTINVWLVIHMISVHHQLVLMLTETLLKIVIVKLDSIKMVISSPVDHVEMNVYLVLLT